MALFSSNLKKMQNELGGTIVDWSRLVSLSSGRCDLSGKNAGEGKALVQSLVKRAEEYSGDGAVLALLFRNITSKGGDFNRSINPKGECPLHIASILADVTMLKALLEAGIKPGLTTHTGATVLHTAIAAGFPDNVKLLLAAGADPGAEDARRNAPLHMAAQLKDPDSIVQMLLAAGAKAYQRNSEGQTPLSIAEEQNHTTCVDLLKESLKIARRNRSRDWICPGCSKPMHRPLRKKVEWYMSLDMWDHLQVTCGECGQVTPATVLDGEV